MKTSCQPGYLLTECMVYLGVVFILLGTGYTALYRCMDNSVALRRNADDIADALHAGERWRADVRSAAGPLRLENTAAGQILLLPGPRGEVAYRFSAGALFRRLGSGPWAPLLASVKSSSMAPDPRQKVTAWRWEDAPTYPVVAAGDPAQDPAARAALRP